MMKFIYDDVYHKDLYYKKTKKYLIKLSRTFPTTYDFNTTNKNNTHKQYEDNISIINVYQDNSPVYHMTFTFYNINGFKDTTKSFNIFNIKYNGKFFSIINHLQDSRGISYIYWQNESKLTNRLLKNRKNYIDSSNHRTAYRLIYQNGRGLYGILAGYLRKVFKLFSKYELNKIFKIIRQDYYKFIGKEVQQ